MVNRTSESSMSREIARDRASLGIVFSTCILIVCSIFARGLFFTGDENVVSIIVLGLGTIAMVALWFKSAILVNFLDGLVFLYVMFYVMGPLHAADPLLSREGAWTTLAAGVMYLAARTIPLNKLRLGSSLLMHSLAAAAGSVAILGFANAWHEWTFPSAYDPSNPTIRLSSVFQYHNTFAAFEGAVMTALILVACVSSNRWTRGLYGAVAGVGMLALLEARSRGELIVLMVLWLLVLLTNKAIRLPLARYLLWWIPSIIPGLAVTAYAMAKAIPTMGWFGVALLIVIPCSVNWMWNKSKILGTVAIERKTAEERSMQRSIGIGLLVGTVAVILAVTLFHRYVSRYLSTHTATGDFISRVLYWRDAVKIFRMRPILGFGAGAWHDLYQMVRTEPYAVTQVHSSLVQAFIDTGVLGGLVWIMMGLLLLWAMIAWASTKGNDKELSGLAYAFAVLGLGLFGHSLVDWDMSFLYMKIVLMICLGIVAATIPVNSLRIERVWMVRALTIVGVLLCATGTWYAWNGLVGNRLETRIVREPAVSQPLEISTELSLAESLHRKVPYSAQYLWLLGEAQQQEAGTLSGALQVRMERAAASSYQTAIQINPYNAIIAETAATAFDIIGEDEQAYHAAQEAFSDSPLTGEYLSQYANAAALRALTMEPSDASQATKIAQATLDAATTWEQKGASDIGKLSPYSETSLGALALVVRNPELAIKWATPALTSKTPQTKDTAQLVVDVAHEQERLPNSQSVLDKFVSAHPPIKASYELLAQVLKR